MIIKLAIFEVGKTSEKQKEVIAQKDPDAVIHVARPATFLKERIKSPMKVVE